MGETFWQPLVQFLHGLLAAHGTIDAVDAERVHLTDSPDAAVAIVRSVAIDRFGLTDGPHARPHWYLGE